MTKLSHPLKGALLALASFCAYACSDVSIKALGHGMNSFQVMFFSALCTLPFILGQIFWQDRRASLRTNLPGLTAIRVLISLLGGWFVIYGASDGHFGRGDGGAELVDPSQNRPPRKVRGDFVVSCAGASVGGGMDHALCLDSADA